MPLAALRPFGVSETYSLFLFSHTAGVALLPLAFALADLLLIELRLLRFLSPFRIFLPSGMRKTVWAEGLVEKLMKHHLIPYPVRLKAAYIAGLYSALLHSALAALFAFM